MSRAVAAWVGIERRETVLLTRHRARLSEKKPLRQSDAFLLHEQHRSQKEAVVYLCRCSLLPLFVSAAVCLCRCSFLPLFVFAVILSEAKDPGTAAPPIPLPPFPREPPGPAVAFCSLIPVPYSLLFLSSPQTTQKLEIPNKDAAI
jgi:hypothetical protein